MRAFRLVYSNWSTLYGARVDWKNEIFVDPTIGIVFGETPEQVAKELSAELVKHQFENREFYQLRYPRELFGDGNRLWIRIGEGIASPNDHKGWSDVIVLNILSREKEVLIDLFPLREPIWFSKKTIKKLQEPQ